MQAKWSCDLWLLWMLFRGLHSIPTAVGNVHWQVPAWRGSVGMYFCVPAIVVTGELKVFVMHYWCTHVFCRCGCQTPVARQCHLSSLSGAVLCSPRRSLGYTAAALHNGEARDKHIGQAKEEKSKNTHQNPFLISWRICIILLVEMGVSHKHAEVALSESAYRSRVLSWHACTRPHCKVPWCIHTFSQPRVRRGCTVACGHTVRWVCHDVLACGNVQVCLRFMQCTLRCHPVHVLCTAASGCR